MHFFGYPDVPGHPVPEGCTVHVLSAPGEDGVAALQALAQAAAPDATPDVLEASRPELPTGELTPRAMAAVVGALLPENAILVDEALTSGVGLTELTSGAPRHDWLCLTGGAIGDGLPMALGAAIACPNRPVIGIQADGSAMYTISALWSYAREQADITTIVCDNGSYAILQHELSRVGAASDGKRAGQLLDLGGPALDFVALASGMGVPATRATTAEELADQLRRALAEPGPHLIDAVARRLGADRCCGTGGCRNRAPGGRQCRLAWTTVSICEVWSFFAFLSSRFSLIDLPAGFLLVDLFGDLSPMVCSLIGNPDGSVRGTLRARVDPSSAARGGTMCARPSAKGSAACST